MFYNVAAIFQNLNYFYILFLIQEIQQQLILKIMYLNQIRGINFILFLTFLLLLLVV